MNSKESLDQCRGHVIRNAENRDQHSPETEEFIKTYFGYTQIIGGEHWSVDGYGGIKVTKWGKSNESS